MDARELQEGALYELPGGVVGTYVGRARGWWEREPDDIVTTVGEVFDLGPADARPVGTERLLLIPAKDVLGPAA